MVVNNEEQQQPFDEPNIINPLPLNSDSHLQSSSSSSSKLKRLYTKSRAGRRHAAAAAKTSSLSSSISASGSVCSDTTDADSSIASFPRSRPSEPVTIPPPPPLARGSASYDDAVRIPVHAHTDVPRLSSTSTSSLPSKANRIPPASYDTIKDGKYESEQDVRQQQQGQLHQGTTPADHGASLFLSAVALGNHAAGTDGDYQVARRPTLPPQQQEQVEVVVPVTSALSSKSNLHHQTLSQQDNRCTRQRDSHNTTIIIDKSRKDFHYHGASAIRPPSTHRRHHQPHYRQPPQHPPFPESSLPQAPASAAATHTARQRNLVLAVLTMLPISYWILLAAVGFVIYLLFSLYSSLMSMLAMPGVFVKDWLWHPARTLVARATQQVSGGGSRALSTQGAAIHPSSGIIAGGGGGGLPSATHTAAAVAAVGGWFGVATAWILGSSQPSSNDGSYATLPPVLPEQTSLGSSRHDSSTSRPVPLSTSAPTVSLGPPIPSPDALLGGLASLKADLSAAEQHHRRARDLLPPYLVDSLDAVAVPAASVSALITQGADAALQAARNDDAFINDMPKRVQIERKALVGLEKKARQGGKKRQQQVWENGNEDGGGPRSLLAALLRWLGSWWSSLEDEDIKNGQHRQQQELLAYAETLDSWLVQLADMAYEALRWRSDNPSRIFARFFEDHISQPLCTAETELGDVVQRLADSRLLHYHREKTRLNDDDRHRRRQDAARGTEYGDGEAASKPVAEKRLRGIEGRLSSGGAAAEEQQGQDAKTASAATGDAAAGDDDHTALGQFLRSSYLAHYDAAALSSVLCWHAREASTYGRLLHQQVGAKDDMLDRVADKAQVMRGELRRTLEALSKPPKPPADRNTGGGSHRDRQRGKSHGHGWQVEEVAFEALLEEAAGSVEGIETELLAAIAEWKSFIDNTWTIVESRMSN